MLTSSRISVQFSVLKGFWNGPSHSVNVYRGHLLQTKDQKEHPDLYQQQVQKPGSVMICGCISALGKAHLHFVTAAEKLMETLEQHLLPSRPQLFQGCICVISKTM